MEGAHRLHPPLGVDFTAVSAVPVESFGELAAYADAVSACTRCRLSAGRTQVVFGAGNPAAELMFVGEAPGFHEDKQGLPFVGQAGKLLGTLLEANPFLGRIVTGRISSGTVKPNQAFKVLDAKGNLVGYRNPITGQLEGSDIDIVRTIATAIEISTR